MSSLTCSQSVSSKDQAWRTHRRRVGSPRLPHTSRVQPAETGVLTEVWVPAGLVAPLLGLQMPSAPRLHMVSLRVPVSLPLPRTPVALGQGPASL